MAQLVARATVRQAFEARTICGLEFSSRSCELSDRIDDEQADIIGSNGVDQRVHVRVDDIEAVIGQRGDDEPAVIARVHPEPALELVRVNPVLDHERGEPAIELVHRVFEVDVSGVDPLEHVLADDLLPGRDRGAGRHCEQRFSGSAGGHQDGHEAAQQRRAEQPLARRDGGRIRETRRPQQERLIVGNDAQASSPRPPDRIIRIMRRVWHSAASTSVRRRERFGAPARSADRMLRSALNLSATALASVMICLPGACILPSGQIRRRSAVWNSVTSRQARAHSVRAAAIPNSPGHLCSSAMLMAATVISQSFSQASFMRSPARSQNAIIRV